jgi:F-type H+-transporting ATPase subunit gamma
MAQKQARPYADTLGSMLHELMASVGSVDHPFMKPGSATAPAGVILMTADKGLAGAFNSNIIRAGELYAKQQPNMQYYTVGIKARNFVRRSTGTDRPTWTLNADDKLESARALAQQVTDDFVEGKISSIVLISPKLISMMSQKPVTRTLVPIERNEIIGDDQAPSGPKGAVEFSPSPEAVLSRLLPKYLEFTIFSAMLETNAAFFAAQLVAMNNATDNAGKLIDTLTIQMNNARQSAITKELLEIVGGAEALNG